MISDDEGSYISKYQQANNGRQSERAANEVRTFYITNSTKTTVILESNEHYRKFASSILIIRVHFKLNIFALEEC